MEDYNNTTEVKYYIAYENDIIHFGELEPLQYIVTGLSNLDIFDKENEFNMKLNELQSK